MIKKLAIVSAVAMLAGNVFAGTLKLTVESSSDSTNPIMVGFYTPENSEYFGKSDTDDKRVQINGESGLELIPVNGVATVEIELPNGIYAISLYHDVNGDGELNKVPLVGLPTEPYGFGNDASGKFGPASFEDSAIEITDGLNEHEIQAN